MYNPSYLIKSRHSVYYFRHPLPITPTKGRYTPRISVSLQTRCPKEALKLARVLEYHTHNLISQLDFSRMDHAEIMSMLKGFYAALLEKKKDEIDKTGPMNKQRVENMARYLEDIKDVIGAEHDHIFDLLGIEPQDGKTPLAESLDKIMAYAGVSFDTDSAEYQQLKEAHKYSTHRKSPHLDIKASTYTYETTDDTGTGKAYSNLILFDLAIFKLTDLPFIIHDSLLFKNVQTDAIKKILPLYNSDQRQIFISIDEIEKYGEEIKELIISKTVVKLENGKPLYTKDWR